MIKLKVVKKEPYNLIEEIANSITHGIGLLLSIVGLVVLIVYSVLQGNIWKIISFTIYGSSLVILYTASTLYHSFPWDKVKRVFQLIDHSAIYFLIAGTYTPFVLVTLRGVWGWTIFGIVWGLAIIGLLYKIMFKTKYEVLSTIFYLLMGWIASVAFVPLYHNLPLKGLIGLIVGGLFYSFGIIFFACKKIPFNHTIWHIFVLGGSISHYFTVLLFV